MWVYNQGFYLGSEFNMNRFNYDQMITYMTVRDISQKSPICLEYNVDITNAYLGRMEWIEDGQEKVVRIYNESKNMWRQIGENLGINDADLNGFEELVLDNRVRKVLGKWQENACGLPHSDKYPKTWRGLLKLLKDSDLKELAENVHKALLQQEQPRKHYNIHKPHEYLL